MKPFQTMNPVEIAEDAIGLFIEFRDVHGYTEEAAALAAVSEVQEGWAASEAINAEMAETEPDDPPAIGDTHAWGHVPS